MKCPKDGVSLKETVTHGVKVDQCHECQGVWLDGQEIVTLLQTFANDAANQYVPLAERTIGTVSPAEFWKETSLTCPRDGVMLKKHFFAGNSGIGIDQCLQCRGVWLDGDELLAVRSHVAPNHRLDRAVVGYSRYETIETDWPYDVGVTNFVEAMNKPEVAAIKLVERTLEFIKIILVKTILKI